MGKQTLVKGMVVGAIVGGALTLFDRNTRRFVTNQLNQSRQEAVYYIKHPAEAVHQLNEGYGKVSNQFSDRLSQALEFLNQVQEISNKKGNKEE
ncbi:YtxH domain-containing protein [Gracilibacillus sp. YIM 98692]|uniref:YtxH domain-containing protein n=1 Tax=Gracilibacillus sp. YIM 98692 TaxID=2663532 RepID=UPI0013D2D226|nr:YtxH domain-containing protein [Gracilibacillus sp. YIM 98692]